MEKHFQKTDRDTQWAMTASNDTWVLTRNAAIETTGVSGIFEGGAIDNSAIRILGDVSSSGMGISAVNFKGYDSRVVVGRDSHIDGRDGFSGVAMNGAGTELINLGLIQGKSMGVYGGSWGTVENHGTITGINGIAFASAGFEVVNDGMIRGSDANAIGGQLAGSSIVNEKGGVLRSLHEVTIELMGAGAGTVENHGLIKAPSGAIVDGVGEIKIINTGRIVGSVEMGGGSDTIDTRKGEVTGLVVGDTGNDHFWIGKSKVTIQEEMGGGYDYIHSTISYALGDNLDSLELLGRKDLKGTGNGEHNYLAGNAGNNLLKGMAGNDLIVGGKGNDRLFSGADIDTFRFAKGDGHDTIEDFLDGTDLLTIDGVGTMAEFNELVIEDVKGGVLIEYDGGEIFLRSIKAVDITLADFNV